MLKAENLVKSYGGRTVLSDIHCTIEPGQCLGVLGPNGSGKSTLLKCMSGAEQSDIGQIWLDKKILSSYSPKERAKRIAVLLQEGASPLPFTVEQFLLMGREPYQSWWPLFKKADYHIVEQWIERFDLAAYRTSSLAQLSGGERQRVAIAQAMVQAPKYLLLDEPLNHLDLQYQCLILDLLTKLKREQQLGIMIILHDINLAAQYCDQILLLKAGRVMGYGTPYEVISQEMMEQIYNVQTVVIEHPQRFVPQILF